MEKNGLLPLEKLKKILKISKKAENCQGCCPKVMKRNGELSSIKSNKHCFLEYSNSYLILRLLTDKLLMYSYSSQLSLCYHNESTTKLATDKITVIKTCNDSEFIYNCLDSRTTLQSLLDVSFLFRISEE